MTTTVRGFEALLPNNTTANTPVPFEDDADLSLLLTGLNREESCVNYSTLKYFFNVLLRYFSASS